MGESFIPNRKTREASKKFLKDYTDDLVARGPEGVRERFEYLDSPLDNSANNPDDFQPFESTFQSLLPENEGLRSYIEGTLKERAGDAVGIEFGGPGVRLFQGFTPGFFKKSIGVTLVDHYRSVAETKKDYGTHQIIEGDIRSPETYEKINDELKGAKADLIMERMIGGWDYVEQVEDDPVLYGEVLSRWYDLLADGGLLLAEVSSFHKTQQILEKWETILHKQYPTQLELRIQKDVYDTPGFILHKLPGAPDKLPLIPIRDLLRP